MSMGKLNDYEGFQAMYDLKQRMLSDYSEYLKEEEFVLSIGTSKDWEQAMRDGGSNEIRIIRVS